MGSTITTQAYEYRERKCNGNFLVACSHTAITQENQEYFNNNNNNNNNNTPNNINTQQQYTSPIMVFAELVSFVSSAIMVVGPVAGYVQALL